MEPCPRQLRTPLTSVNSIAVRYMIAIPANIPAATCTRHTHRLESQIDKTLELARIEGGGRLAEQAIRLDQWLERVLNGVVAAEGEGAQLRVTIDPDLPPVAGDTSALQLILRNLVENSLRHGDRSLIHIDVAARRAGNAVELRYRDDGRGFEGDPDSLGRLFLRGGGSRGTGVGLYLVRVLMERMGGTVRFAHADGGGFAATMSFVPGNG